MIKAIIFDFDGTLSNRQRNAYNVFKDYLRPYFKDFDKFEFEAVLQDFLTDDANGTFDVHTRMIPFLKKYGKYFPEDFEEVFTKFYYDNMYRYCELKPETREVLEVLKAQGKYKLAILSNGQSKSQHDKIDYVDITKYMDEVLVSGDIGINKPDKRVFEYLADKLNVKLEECVYVGDVFSSDILGAHRAGMQPVWMKTDFERPADFYKGCVIKDLRELLILLGTDFNC